MHCALNRNRKCIALYMYISVTYLCWDGTLLDQRYVASDEMFSGVPSQQRLHNQCNVVHVYNQWVMHWLEQVMKSNCKAITPTEC